MITRSKLVEQLREYQIRSQHKWSNLLFFSPKPQIVTSSDIALALGWALLFSVLVISLCIAVYFTHFWISLVLICLGVLLPIRLKISRQSKLARKRLLLPLSM